MLNTRKNLQFVVDRLNEMYRLDPEATKALVNSRVPCNSAILDHPSIICKDGKVGLLGVLNSFFTSPRIGVNEDEGALHFAHIVDALPATTVPEGPETPRDWAIKMVQCQISSHRAPEYWVAGSGGVEDLGKRVIYTSDLAELVKDADGQ